MSAFDRPHRRAPESDQPASSSQEIAAVKKRVDWLYRGLALLAATLIGGTGAYYRNWQDSLEKRGADRHRLDVVERDMTELRQTINAIWPLLLNPPARPAHGDDR
jgi:membrane protein required for beta-lactamase induction